MPEEEAEVHQREQMALPPAEEVKEEIRKARQPQVCQIQAAAEEELLKPAGPE